MNKNEINTLWIVLAYSDEGKPKIVETLLDRDRALQYAKGYRIVHDGISVSVIPSHVNMTGNPTLVDWISTYPQIDYTEVSDDPIEETDYLEEDDNGFNASGEEWDE